eukprot:145674_1
MDVRDNADKQKLKTRNAGTNRTKVLNKAPAPLQVTAEQILREALERQDEVYRAPAQKITDPDELKSYQLRKRKECEDVIRRQRHNVGVWMKYAKWEATQQEWERVRSIYERALDVNYRVHSLWLKYAEFEMKNKFVNRARNVWDRAVQLLPRVDQLWYKYALMEEMLGNWDGARRVFERWMKWHPPANAWESYIKLEMRCSGTRDQRLKRARQIYRRYTKSHADLGAYMKWAKFEEKRGDIVHAREVYALALEELGEDAHKAHLFTAFASLEERTKETDRARVIYKYALDHVPKHLAADLYKKYTSFEKQHGSRGSIDGVILSKRRFQYEEELKSNSRNYDIWFDYVKLEESNGDVERIREVYERSIAEIPPLKEKRYWRRYIFLWMRYAIFEELTAEDTSRAREVYAACLSVVPHTEFTFAKLWLAAAHLELRAHQLDAARRLLGRALGICPKPKLFAGYIEIELKLLEFDRCRKLYEKQLEYAPENCTAWKKYAELEQSVKEFDRARGIFEMAVNQEVLDMPELLWKAYIDFEISLNEQQRARDLYERLLERTKHVKVWLSMAKFEIACQAFESARKVFEKADQYFRTEVEAREERAMLLEAWLEFETLHGTDESKEKVQKKQPRRIKKKRLLKDEHGEDAGWQEYADYIFPDTQSRMAGLAVLEAARRWKKQKIEEDGKES